MLKENDIATLDSAQDALNIRSRVRDTMKRTIEKEILRPVLRADFSKVEHVRNPTIDLEREERADGQLLCIGDIDNEETFRAFTERLTALSH